MPGCAELELPQPFEAQRSIRPEGRAGIEDPRGSRRATWRPQARAPTVPGKPHTPPSLRRLATRARGRAGWRAHPWRASRAVQPVSARFLLLVSRPAALLRWRYRGYRTRGVGGGYPAPCATGALPSAHRLDKSAFQRPGSARRQVPAFLHHPVGGAVPWPHVLPLPPLRSVPGRNPASPGLK
jgi:hypothetical protein